MDLKDAEKLAARAYAIYRGSQIESIPKHWDDLSDAQRSMLNFIVQYTAEYLR